MKKKPAKAMYEMMGAATKCAVLIADTHIGSLYGLINTDKKIRLDNGGEYTPNPAQIQLWQWWRQYWDEWVPRVCRGDEYCIIHAGDLIEGEHHRATDVISANPAMQSQMVMDVMAPEIAKAKGGYYQIRGTTSHVGESARAEEGLARALGAVPNERGQYARPFLWKMIGGCRLLVQHSIGVTSSAAYESSAVMRALVEAYTRSARSDDLTPDVLVRAHRHTAIEIRWPTERGQATACTLPSWQLPTNYALEKGFLTSQHGGLLVRDGDEEFYTRSWVQFVKLGRPE